MASIARYLPLPMNELRAEALVMLAAVEKRRTNTFLGVSNIDNDAVTDLKEKMNAILEEFRHIFRLVDPNTSLPIQERPELGWTLLFQSMADNFPETPLNRTAIIQILQMCHNFVDLSNQLDNERKNPYWLHDVTFGLKSVVTGSTGVAVGDHNWLQSNVTSFSVQCTVMTCVGAIFFLAGGYVHSISPTLFGNLFGFPGEAKRIRWWRSNPTSEGATTLGGTKFRS
jgi:hypothetical protein